MAALVQYSCLECDSNDVCRYKADFKKIMDDAQRDLSESLLLSIDLPEFLMISCRFAIILEGTVDIQELETKI